MICSRYDPTNVFALVPQLSLALDPVLAQLDPLLDDDQLFDQVRTDCTPPPSRPGIPFCNGN